MDTNSTNQINVGGSIDRALNGKYSLKVGDVLSEAWKLTLQHFARFTPAILLLMLLQLSIFYAALKLQLGDIWVLLDAFTDMAAPMDESIFQAIFMANFSYEVISAPIFASLCMMSMSHATGFNTKLSHITKGLAFTVPVILATLASLILQAASSNIIPMLSLYLSIAFSNSVFLICEKRVTPMRSLWLSLRACNRKLLPLFALYSIVVTFVFMSIALYGIGLVITLPFYFHVKAIIYREMFGITLTVVATKTTNEHRGDDNHPTATEDTAQPTQQKPSGNSDTFDA
jgi:uncharacterized membrane protein